MDQHDCIFHINVEKGTIYRSGRSKLEEVSMLKSLGIISTNGTINAGIHLPLSEEFKLFFSITLLNENSYYSVEFNK